MVSAGKRVSAVGWWTECRPPLVDGGPDLNLYFNAILSNKRVRLRWLRRWQEIVPMLSRQWAHHFSLVAAGRWPLVGGSRRYLACCFAEGAVLG